MSRQVKIQDKHEPAEPKRHRELMQKCGDQLAHSLSRLLVAVFDQIESAVSIYRPAADNKEENLAFDLAVAELKDRRLWIGKSFYNGLSNSLKRFSKGVETTEEMLNEPLEGASDDVDPLQEKQRLELDMAIANLLSNVHYEFADTFDELGKRLAVVNTGKRIDVHSLCFPAGPELVCRVFLQILQGIDISFEIKLILLDLFDIKVMQRAEPAYDLFNAALKEAGILPNLKAAVTTNNQSTPVKNASSTTTKQVSEQDLFGQIQHLLDKHQGTKTPGDFAGLAPFKQYLLETPQPLVATSELLMDGGDSALQQARKELTVFIENDKAKVEELGEIQNLGWVIQLVGLLFEYIIDDKQLPCSIKALLSGLYRPLLLAALTEHQLFISNQHPLLRLLDSLSQSGLRYSPGDRNTLGVLAKIQTTVAKLTKSPDLDIREFNQLQKDFSDFIKAGDKQTQFSEQNAIQALEGRQRLIKATEVVNDRLYGRMHAREFPEAIESLVLGPWKNYLVMTYLKSGEDSPLWDQAWLTTDQLIEKTQGRDQSKLNDDLIIQQRQTLLDQLRQGLAMIGESESSIEDLLENMELAESDKDGKQATQKSVSKENKTKSESSAPQDGKLDGVNRIEQLREILPSEWQAGQKTTRYTENDYDSVETQALMTHLKALPFGTWFEFKDTNTELVSRGKLAWVNGVSLTFMFVNQDGKQIAIKSLYQLADEIQAGIARIVVIEKKTLLNRALKTIYSVLTGGAIASEKKSV